jgi:hypothetical protein
MFGVEDQKIAASGSTKILVNFFKALHVTDTHLHIHCCEISGLIKCALFLAEDTIYSDECLDMLERYTLQIQDARLTSVVFHQDRVLPHWASVAHSFMNLTFGNNWCGRAPVV